ncbi:MAG: hypothetical protein GXP06_15330 [Alphaproteobacteria bacterium]|nr:hypothetical protein [Alphaproteobacteria bacterium]
MARTLSRHTNIALVALMAVGAALVFYAMRGPGGVGGTGVTDGPGGVGGTGIFGRIDEFGSIWVNGHEIHYDDDLPLMYRGGIVDSENFALGQMVAIIADKTNDDWRARAARIVEEVIGPIEVSADGASVAVLKQKILFTEETIYANGALETIAPGSMVAVSGLRTPAGAILATRIEPVGPKVGLFVRGPVANINSSSFSIYGLNVHYKGLSLSEGGIVAISGAIVDAQFTAQEVRKDGAFEGYSIDDISYQGVVDVSSQGSDMRVGEFLTDAFSSAAAVGDGRAPTLVVLEGRLDQSRVTVDIDGAQPVFQPQNLQPAPDGLRRVTDDEAEQSTVLEDTETRASDSEDGGSQTDDTPRDGSPARDTTEATAVDERVLENGQSERTATEGETNDQTATPERDGDGLSQPEETSQETDGANDEARTDRTDDPTPVERPNAGDQPSRERPSRPERPAQDRPERPERPQRRGR